MARDYLQADRDTGGTGRASDLLVAGTMAAMFFTPIGSKVIGGAAKGLWRGAKGVGKGAYGMARRTQPPGLHIEIPPPAVEQHRLIC